MKRKTLVILLVVCILSQIGGTWMIYTTALAIHKQNKKLRISDQSHWITQVLTPKEFKAQQEGNEELVIAGRIFDIVSVTVGSSTVTVTMVEDKAENKLKRTLEGLQRSSSGWSEMAKKIAAFGTSLYEISESTAIELLTLTTTQLLHSKCYAMNYRENRMSSIDHPPSWEL